MITASVFDGWAEVWLLMLCLRVDMTCICCILRHNPLEISDWRTRTQKPRRSPLLSLSYSSSSSSTLCSLLLRVPTSMCAMRYLVSLLQVTTSIHQQVISLLLLLISSFYMISPSQKLFSGNEILGMIQCLLNDWHFCSACADCLICLFCSYRILSTTATRQEQNLLLALGKFELSESSSDILPLSLGFTRVGIRLFVPMPVTVDDLPNKSLYEYAVSMLLDADIRFELTYWYFLVRRLLQMWFALLHT